MSDTRVAFSWPLFGLHQGITVLGYALPPSPYRPLLFIPILLISYHLVFRSTTGDIADVGVGGGILAQLAYAFDYLVTTNVQKELHRVYEAPGQISSAPLKNRLAWAWHLHNSPRGVGWAHEPAHIRRHSSSRTAPQSRKSFLLSRICAALLCVVVQLIFMVINNANPALTPGAQPLVTQPFYIRVLSTAGVGVPGLAQINVLHCIASIVFVGTGISQPTDWPPLFGSFKYMYSVQNFWRNTWHQLLRRPVLTIPDFLIHRVLRIPRPLGKPNLALSLLKLHAAFLVSALIHLGGEFMMLGYGGSGAFYFFILQAWAITLEIAIRYLVTGSPRPPSGNAHPGVVLRLLGYVWAVCWFVFTAPFIQQPMVDAGLFVTPVVWIDGKVFGA